MGQAGSRLRRPSPECGDAPGAGRDAAQQTDPPPAAAGKETVVNVGAVDELVDEFMSDSAINSAFLPDVLERALYRNVLLLMLGIMGRVLDTTSFSFLGHDVTVRMAPQDSPPV